MKGYGCNSGETDRQPGTQGAVNGRSIQSVQIPRHPGCWWVCILADKETMRLSTVAPFPRCSMTLSLMGNFDFFFKEKFPNLSKGMVAQVAGRVIMAYQKSRDTQSQGPQSQTKREKSRCLHRDSSEGTLLASHISPERDESVPGAHSAFSAHMDNGSIAQEVPLPQ